MVAPKGHPHNAKNAAFWGYFFMYSYFLPIFALPFSLLSLYSLSPLNARGMTKITIFDQYFALTQKWCKIEP